MTTVMIVLPDAESLQRIAGSLAYLSAKKYRVHVGIEADPPGGPNLGSFNGQYLGLSVSRLPVLADDRWRPFATVVRTWLRRLRVPPDQVRPAAQPGTATAGGGWLRPRLLGALARLERAVPAPAMVLAALEQRRPDLLVVTRLGGLDAVQPSVQSLAQPGRQRSLRIGGRIAGRPADRRPARRGRRGAAGGARLRAGATLELAARRDGLAEAPIICQRLGSLMLSG